MFDKRYEELIKVRSYECDINGNLKTDQAIRIMEEMGEHQMFEEGFSYDDVMASGKTLLVNRLDAEFYGVIKKHQVIRVQSWPCVSKGMILPRRYAILNEAGDEVIADIISQWTVVDIKAKKILKADAVDLSMYYREQLDRPLPKRNKFTRDLDMGYISDERVSYNHIDCNGHMNNVDYFSMIQKHIPEMFEGWRVAGVKINFAKEAMLNDNIKILRDEGTVTFETEPSPILKKIYNFRLEKLNGELSAEMQVMLTK